MIWNCDGEIKEIKFKYSSVLEEYYCRIAGRSYVREKCFINAGPWDWYREGYTLEWARWVK